MSDQQSMFDAESSPSEGRDWGVLGTMASWSWRILVCAAALTLIVAILIELKFVVVPLTTVLAGTTIGGVIGGILAVPLVATVSGALGQVRRWRAEGGVPTADPISD